MFNQSTNFPFPLAIHDGRICASGGDEAIRGKIIQVLFTAPGERVNLPDFGCGLFNLVFEPGDGMLAAAMEFSIREGLTRWMGNDIRVEVVEVMADGETVTVEIVYARRLDQVRQAVRLNFK